MVSFDNEILYVFNVPLNMIQSAQIGDEEYGDRWYIIKSNESVNVVDIWAIYDNVVDESLKTW